MIELDFEKSLDGAKGKFLLQINTTLEMGNFISIFGKSGVGKTTILRILAGLDTPDRGKIIVAGQTYFNSTKKINLAPQKRKIGFVFQNYALFPHLNVYQNIVFALKDKGQESKKRANEIIALMELEQLGKKKISSISGGQQQRVALARALVSSPDMLLLDEPLSALDGEMRLKLQDEIKAISSHFHLSSFLVSHDIGEVFRLSDKVICLHNGKISKMGTRDEIFLNAHLSGKIQISGEILHIAKKSLISIADILVSDGSIIKVVLSPQEARMFKMGDCVAVVAKAFNPSLVLL